MIDPLALLATRAGSYAGRGENHEGQPFEGCLSVAPLLDGLAIRIGFRATGDDGTVYHEEETLVTRTQDQVVLFTVSSNLAGGLLHGARPADARSDAATTLTFGAGARDDEGAFREEISLDLFDDGTVAYRFARGLPGGSFADRSAVRMRQADAAGGATVEVRG